MLRRGIAMCALAACGSDGPQVSGDAAIDAGDVDAGLDAGVALCARPGVIFCEDFESLAPGPATSSAWTTESANGALAIDTEHARGARALRVSTSGNGRARLQKTGLAFAGNSVWGTMHVWAAAFPTAPDYAHYTLVELAGSGNTSLVRPVGGQYAPGSPAGSFWGVGSDGGPTGDWTNWRRTTPSEGGKWLCVEMHLDAQTSAVEIFLDGVAKPELSVTKTSHGGNAVDFVFPTFDRIWFGWWLYQANPTPGTYTVWFDDIALAPTRLGCS